MKLDRLAKVQTYHSEAYARFLKRMASTPDGDGTLLDHSILVFGSNMSNSDLHNNDPLPSVVIGKGCGKIKGGQHLHYPQDTPQGLGIADVIWLDRYLSRITDQDLNAGFISSGASQPVAREYTRLMRERIVQLQRVVQSQGGERAAR